MPRSPLETHAATPAEVRERVLAERRGVSFLVYRDGGGRQVVFDLEGDRVSVGRRAGCGVELAWDAGVSRLHAELERVGPDWVLCDEGLSRNGTFVNGERILGRRRLRDRDVLSVGETLIAYCAADEPSTGAPTATVAGGAAPPELSAAQRRTLQALCRPVWDSTHAAPASNQEIADELVVTVDTVKGTLRQLFEAFGLHDVPQNQKRVALAARALRAGLVAPISSPTRRHGR